MSNNGKKYKTGTGSQIQLHKGRQDLKKQSKLEHLMEQESAESATHSLTRHQQEKTPGGSQTELVSSAEPLTSHMKQKLPRTLRELQFFQLTNRDLGQ